MDRPSWLTGTPLLLEVNDHGGSRVSVGSECLHRLRSLAFLNAPPPSPVTVAPAQPVTTVPTPPSPLPVTTAPAPLPQLPPPIAISPTDDGDPKSPAEMTSSPVTGGLSDLNLTPTPLSETPVEKKEEREQKVEQVKVSPVTGGLGELNQTPTALSETPATTKAPNATTSLLDPSPPAIPLEPELPERTIPVTPTAAPAAPAPAPGSDVRIDIIDVDVDDLLPKTRPRAGFGEILRAHVFAT